MKKFKFTWFDGLLVAILLVLIAGTCIKFLSLGNTSTAKAADSFTYTIQIEGLRNYTVDAIQVGDALYEEAGKGCIGTISDVTVTPAVRVITLNDGTAVEAPVEDRYDVLVTVSAQGTVSDSSYEIGTYDIFVNHTDTFFTKYSIWYGYVQSVG